ncbi:MAG: amidohydrolase family protein [Bacteroidota bacterium]
MNKHTNILTTGFAVATTFLLTFFLSTPFALAQSVPTPGAPQTQRIVLKGGTLHLGNGQPAAKSDIALKNGVISEIAPNIPADSSEILNVAGKHIYPGILAPSTQMGLDEIESVRATEDKKEVGAINPNVRAIIGYNADSRVTPTIRSNGILLAEVAPTGDLFAGSASVVRLDAWNWEDAYISADREIRNPISGVHLYWPRMRFREAWWAPPIEEQKKKTKAHLQKVETAMEEARRYWQQKTGGQAGAVDVRWEALIPVLEKRIPLFIHASDEKQIQSAVGFMLRHDIRIVVVGGADAWLMTDLLRQYDIPVVLRQPHSLPRLEDDDVDRSYKTARILHEAGLTVALSMRDFWNQRNLPFQAGTAAAYGLDKEAALQLITLNPAKILGIGDRYGSLEKGKSATLLVSSGDLLDMPRIFAGFSVISCRAASLSRP